ncbi:MAG: hypothetical protein ACP5QT_05430 [Brevinematia bacterium]
MKNYLCHSKILKIVKSLIEKNITGMSLIFSGKKGVGKFTLGRMMAEKLLGGNPFFSRDFLFYRNDDFLLKTRFFLKLLAEGSLDFKTAINYFSYLISRGYNAINLREISNIKLNSLKGKTKIDLVEFFSEFEAAISDEATLFSYLSEEKIKESLLNISLELSKKETIPIDFIRMWKEFEVIKSVSGKKIILIGDFEQATIEAQNSALKILEEPSPESLVIITTSDISKILPTIVSRCIVLKFGVLQGDEAYRILNLKPFGKRFNNTVDLMKDYIYGYSDKVKKTLSEFLVDIAPNIQYRGNKLFEFIESMVIEGEDFLELFFFELLELLRNLHIARQQYLRKSNLKAESYVEIIEQIVSKTCVSEIHKIGFEVIKTIEFIKRSNFTEALLLPDLLINLSRWYQKALLRKKI